MIQKILNIKTLQLVIRFFLGFVFIYASMNKISSPGEFALSISNYQLFPNFLINFTAVFIPWLELVCGFGLIFGFHLRENAFVYLSLLITFTLLIALSMIRGLDIECGCFGSEDSSKVGFLKILENLALILLSAYLFHTSIKEKSPVITLNK
ncbi:MAG: DoxX family membrane protein [Ignavibacteria bacterium]|nr:DoxX family membrane protein [Ignavibacteria bacterium]